jgi:CRISP-associated protein Cas1
LAGNNCLVAWVGEQGVRLYAHSIGGTFSDRRLLQQARLYADETQRLAVVYRMYQKRFLSTPLQNKTIEQVRGMEGSARTRLCIRRPRCRRSETPVIRSVLTGLL